MAEAVDALVTSGNDTGQVACRVMYRLAHHADLLYAGIQAQKQSPEWNTAQAVIKQKRHQVLSHTYAQVAHAKLIMSVPLLTTKPQMEPSVTQSQTTKWFWNMFWQTQSGKAPHAVFCSIPLLCLQRTILESSNNL